MAEKPYERKDSLLLQNSVGGHWLEITDPGSSEYSLRLDACQRCGGVVGALMGKYNSGIEPFRSYFVKHKIQMFQLRDSHFSDIKVSAENVSAIFCEEVPVEFSLQELGLTPHDVSDFERGQRMFSRIKEMEALKESAREKLIAALAQDPQLKAEMDDILTRLYGISGEIYK
jgi:hypothetical protein